MKIKSQAIISTGQFENITVELELDTEKLQESKNILKALHRHFHGLFNPQTENLINQLNKDRYDTSAKSNLDVIYDLEE